MVLMSYILVGVFKVYNINIEFIVSGNIESFRYLES